MGYALLTTSWWGIVLTVVLAVWFEFKSRREEEFLRDYFPTYADYAQKVAKFLPRIY
jgi:protein-S-isoprenylcysteine O-methyltransferase Ste14